MMRGAAIGHPCGHQKARRLHTVKVGAGAFPVAHRLVTLARDTASFPTGKVRGGPCERDRVTPMRAARKPVVPPSLIKPSSN